MKNRTSFKIWALILLIGFSSLCLSRLSAQRMPWDGYGVDTTAIVKSSQVNPALHSARDKKLIQTSSDLQWSYVKEHIKEMEAAQPGFDGVAASMNGSFGRDFIIVEGETKWSDEDIQLDLVSKIEWKNFTENFVIIYLGDDKELDFYNDRKWSVVNYNAGMLSKMIEAGGFKGIFMDAENYYDIAAWRFRPSLYPGKSFDQVRAMCRKRGADFMRALDSEVSRSICIFDMIWFDDYWADIASDTGRYGLYTAFKDGMMEAALERDEFVEGNEMAYYFHEAVQYTDYLNEMRYGRFVKYGGSDLQHLYDNVAMGHGIYPTLVYGQWRLTWGYSPEEMELWWKHKVYHALLTSDKYVWIWSEGWDWWGDGGKALGTIKPIMEEAKELVARQEGLGYECVKYGGNWSENLVDPSERWHLSKAPAIRITSPENNSVTDGKVSVRAEVDGEAERVEFYLNSMRVGIDKYPPYRLDMAKLVPGTYTLFARVFDLQKDHMTSVPVVFEVK